jgi:hypothetical protein
MDYLFVADVEAWSFHNSFLLNNPSEGTIAECWYVVHRNLKCANQDEHRASGVPGDENKQA